MKFKITMKDPDGVWNAVEDAARDSTYEVKGLNDEERDALVESRSADIKESLKKWFEYDEVVVIEIDTEAGTATVCPQ